MRLAISNIAWDVVEDEQIVSLLRKHDIDAIDVAPGKYFLDPPNATDKDIALVRGWWADRGIEITGMQALLFGTSGLNVFGTVQTQAEMLTHLKAVCRIGAQLGARRLVFGSPKNRDRAGLTDQKALEAAVQFFRQLGDIAHIVGVVVCLEPNPPCYGANFMTTSFETAHIVEAIAHPAVKMQLDTGAMTINCEEVTAVLQACSHLIGHVHASEPDLLPLGDGGTDHRKVYLALQRYLPEHLVSIEMLATKDEPHLAAIERAVRKAISSYRPDARKN